MYSPKLTFKDKYGSVGPTLGAKVRDMRPATRVVINTAPRAPLPRVPLAHMAPPRMPQRRSVGHSD